MPRDALVHVSDFIPKDDQHIYDEDGKRQYAKGQLCAALRHLIWLAMADPGPSCWTHLEMARNLSRQDWIEDPARALADIDTLTAAWDQALARGVDGTELDAPEAGDWFHYTKARGLFGKYHAALVEMRLAKPLPEEVVAA